MHACSTCTYMHARTHIHARTPAQMHSVKMANNGMRCQISPPFLSLSPPLSLSVPVLRTRTQRFTVQPVSQGVTYARDQHDHRRSKSGSGSAALLDDSSKGVPASENSNTQARDPISPSQVAPAPPPPPAKRP